MESKAYEVETQDQAPKRSTQPKAGSQDQEIVDEIKTEMDMEGVGKAFSLDTAYPPAKKIDEVEEHLQLYYDNGRPMTLTSIIWEFMRENGPATAKPLSEEQALHRLQQLRPWLRQWTEMVQRAEKMVSAALWGHGPRLSEAQVVTRLVALARPAAMSTNMVQARHVVWFNYMNQCHDVIAEGDSATDVCVPTRYRSCSCNN